MCFMSFPIIFEAVAGVTHDNKHFLYTDLCLIRQVREENAKIRLRTTIIPVGVWYYYNGLIEGSHYHGVRFMTDGFGFPLTIAVLYMLLLVIGQVKL